MITSWPGYTTWTGQPTMFTWGTRCRAREWCLIADPHTHGLACSIECRCIEDRHVWDAEENTEWRTR